MRRGYARYLWRVFGDRFVQSKVVHECDCKLREDCE